MTERRLELARVALAALFLLLAIVSVVRTLPPTWRWLEDQHERSAALDDVDRIEAAGYRSLLPVEAYNFFRAHMRADDRYFVLAEAGRSTQRGVDLPTALKSFGRYYLLPALLVEQPQEATVVLSFGPEPKTLGLRYEKTHTHPNKRWRVARVR